MRALYNGFFSRMGLPRQLHSDQGRNFESKLVSELCSLTGVHKTRTTPFHPRSDGQTERANRTILQMLRAKAMENPTDWPNRLPAVLAAYRMTQHSTTSLTPNKLMLGREVLLPCSLIARPPEDDTTPTVPFVTSFRDTLRSAHAKVREHVGRTAKRQKKHFDGRVKPMSFALGQHVWLFWPRPLVTQQSHKLTHLWTGPWTVVNIKSDLIVVIRNNVNQKHQTVHIDRLWPCKSPVGQIPPTAATKFTPRLCDPAL